MPSYTVWLAGEVRIFFTALSFLTRIPSPSWVGFEEGWLARSTVYFPVIGAMVGLVGGGAFWLTRAVWPDPVALVAALAAIIWLTQAFHEDALADACDGFGGGSTSQQILEIMGDSRLGTYGVVALILMVAAKLAALSALPPQEVIGALVAGHVLGRWSSLPLIWRYPYVREGAGTGKLFAGGVTPGRLAVASLLTFFLLTGALGWRMIFPLLLAVGLTALSGRYFRRRIGGITGDCLGAANQIVEVGTYLVLAVPGR